jgi:hypothetical protein
MEPVASAVATVSSSGPAHLCKAQQPEPRLEPYPHTLRRSKHR